MSNFLANLIIVIGVLFNIFGCIGLIRLPDIYNRLQAATKCVTLGTCMILAGSMVLVSSPAALLKCLICLIFILLTSPTAAHALALGSHASGVRLWEKSIIDQYESDKNQSTEKKVSSRDCPVCFSFEFSSWH